MLFRKKGIDLATFVGGIVRALTKAQQALPKARREQIEKHFTKDEETGVYHPKTMTFKVSETQTVTVPNYVLARVNNIGIDSAVITCCAKIVDVEQSEINCELSDHDKQAKYCVIPAKNGGGNFEIKIMFEKKTDCEAESKLSEFLQSIVEIESNQDT